MENKNQLLTVSASEGKILNIAGGNYRIIISGAQTQDEFAVIEMTVPPNAGPVPHAHEDINESFFVVQGTVQFYTEEGNYEAKQGAYVNIPKGGLIHNFKNETDQPAVLLCTVMPAGAERMFEEVSNFFNNNSDLTEEEKKNYFSSISKKYNTLLYPPDFFQDNSK